MDEAFSLGPSPQQAAYSRSVLKAAMLAAEAGGADLLDELADVFARAAASAPAQCDGPRWTVKTYAYLPAAAAFEPPASGCAPSGPEVDCAALRSCSLCTGCMLTATLTGCAGGCAGPPGVAAPALQQGLGAAWHVEPAVGTVTVESCDNLFEGGTGCHEWDAGYCLAEIILSASQLTQGRRCLELGSGVGVASACLARSGARHVTLTDGSDAALEALRRNLARNCSPGQLAALSVVPLVWEQVSPADCAALAPDVVLGSDLAYDPLLAPGLARVLSLLLRPRATPAADAAQQPCRAQPQGQAEGAPAWGAGAPTPFALLVTAVRQQATMEIFLAEVAASGLAAADVTAALLPANVRFIGLGAGGFAGAGGVARESVVVHLLRHV